MSDSKNFSYDNVYDKIDFEEALRRISDEKTTYKGEEDICISDDITIVHSKYLYEEYDAEGRLSTAHSFGKYKVVKNGEVIYSFINIDDQVVLKDGLILHSNGRKYLAFHVDLYGISFLDTESGEVYNYVPEGLPHDSRYPCGESFIITDVHYDANTDLIAYGGCYWADTSDVYVGELRDLLNFDPHLISMHRIIDSDRDNDDVDDVDFARWEESSLVVNCDGKEISVPIEKLLSTVYA